MTQYQTRAHEDYLFKIVNRVLEWHGAEYTTKEEKQDIADLVMLELLNYPLPEVEPTYRLKNSITGEIVIWTVKQIQEEVNRDRTEDWIPYTDDWRDGLEFTDYYLMA